MYFLQKLDKYDANLTALNTSLYRVCEKYKDAENMIAIIKPLTTLEVVTELPSESFYKSQVAQLIQTITQLGSTQFFLEEDLNPVTGERDMNHLYLKLPGKEYIEKVYHAQPLFGCLIVHKLSHIQVCPFLRYSPDMCIMCVARKDQRCIHDMCKDCCSRQKYGILVCQCSLQLVQASIAQKKEIVSKDKSITETLCDKCPNKRDRDCPNKMCSVCCPIQAIRFDCPFHDESNYCREIKTLPGQLIGRKMLSIVSELHIKMRHELKCGRYDWFRPIYGTDVQESMRKANRELQEVLDNGSIIRGTTTTRYKREGKILTFQANEPLTIWLSPSEKVFESIDNKGQPFVEYYYSEEASREERTIWVKNSLNKYRTYSIDDYEKYINAPNLKIIKDFHIMILGLDKKVFSIRELYNEIYNSIRNMVGSVELNNILVIDSESFLMEVFNSSTYQEVDKLEQNIFKLGRAACVKLDNVLDAFALITKEAKLTLPLNNRKNDEPLIFPSKYLLKLIEDYSQNPQNAQLNYLTAGSCFAAANKEMEQINNNMKDLMSGGRGGGGGGGKRKKKKQKN
eukprot:TRINITY_DN4789_c0_g1_i11.p1 TRINITY_DN4789_c0_g1~~TRINITY_DN4789_c0_g1_i11.p1  ORF type:complete len:569 (+),score=114.26 TRINITY_DN4789_c0_g1_i11:156-1862(+)